MIDSKPLFTDVEEAKDFFVSQFGVNETFDFGLQKVHVYTMPVIFVYINGLVDSRNVLQVLAMIQPTQRQLRQMPESEVEYFRLCFPHYSITEPKDKKELLVGILSGQVGFVTPSGFSYLVEFRTYPGRQPEEPDNEKVIRGSRDGFTENMIQNTGLIRRRIRDASLRCELHKISEKGQTDTIICFMKGVASEEHLSAIRDRLSQIHHDGLTMADKSLEEWLFKQGFHPLPFVRYTERPDIAAAHLLEGHIAIIVDTSPSVILVPITFFHHLQHAEEYRQAPFIGTFVRFLRFFATLCSILLLPFWFLLVKHPEHIPSLLNFIGLEKPSKIPVIAQIFMADFGVDFLRLAAIHTPTPLSTALGLVAAALLGQIAIQVGLFAPEVVLYTAITAIFTFAIPSYELGVSNKVFRGTILLATALFGVNGFFISIFLLFTYICAIRPLNVPYLWPLVPFFPTAFMRVVVRFPITFNALRPYIVGSHQRKRS